MSRHVSPSNRVWLMAIALVGASSLALWWIDQSNGDDDTNTSAAPFTVSVEGPADPGPTPEESFLAAFEGLAEPIPEMAAGLATSPDSTAQTTPLAAVESVAVVPHVRRGDNLHRFYVPKEFFEDWYADATDDEIGLAKLKLEALVWNRMSEAADTWFASGMQDEDEYLDRDKIAEDPEAFMSGQSGESHGLYTALKTDDMGGGVMRRRLARLPWEEHQALYNLQDESFWLVKEWRRRSRADR